MNIKKYGKIEAETLLLDIRDFTIRHPGHGATHYHNGKGTDYTNNYETKIYNKLPTKGEVLDIDVSFNPYGLNISFNTIKEFIVKATIYF